MKKIWILLIPVLILSCIQQEEEDIVAQVNDDKLTIEELKANFSGDEWEILTKEKKHEFVQDWIQLTLLSQEADKLGISELPRIKSRIETAEKSVKSNTLLAQKLSEIKISEDDLFNYYKLHKSKFRKSHKEYKVQRIFITDESKLGEVRDEIKSSSFAEAAKKYSEESAGKNGGYLGFISQKTTNKDIWNALKSLQKHRYKTIETSQGYYILRYYDTRTVYEEKTFLEVSDSIRKVVLENRKEEIFNNLIEELKKKSEISISI